MSPKFCIDPIAGSCARYFGSFAVVRNCMLALFLVAASGLAVAAVTQPSKPNPCNLTASDAASMNSDFSTDVHAADKYMSAIAGMLKGETFGQLDCLADRARSEKERFPGGAWKLRTLYLALYNPVQYPVMRATQDEWTSHLQRLKQWTGANPQSTTARVALARAYIGYAYDARGARNSGTVSESGWKLFKERTAEAKRILKEASTLPTKCPEWYAAMLLVAQNEGWAAADARALFDEAFKSEPGYFYDARVLANYLLPKWTGQKGVTEKFIQDIADRIGGDQGDIFYFQVAIAPHLICGCEDDANLSMARIGHGLEASEKRYGVSMLNLNLVALVATRSNPGDPILADKVLTRIGEQWDEETWTEKKDFDMAKSFASFMARRLTIETTADSNMQTPEGLRYKSSFEKPYKELVQQCVQPGGSQVGRFKALTNVGSNGTVEDVRIYSNSPAAHCVYDKLRALQQQKDTVFPPPPHSSYWVKLDLDWAEFAPVAAK